MKCAVNTPRVLLAHRNEASPLWKTALPTLWMWNYRSLKLLCTPTSQIKSTVLPTYSSSNHSLTRFNVKTRNKVFKARQVCYIISGEETNLHPSNLPASLSISASLCLVTKMLFDIQLFFLALPDRMGKWANHLSSSTEMESAWCTVNKLRIIKTRLTPTRKTQEAFLFEKSNDLLKSAQIFKKYHVTYT